MVTISRHANKRMKERLGLPKNARQRIADRAFESGKGHSDYQHGPMKRYLDSTYLAHRKATCMRIYAEHLWLFGGETLITVIPIPAKFKKQI